MAACRPKDIHPCTVNPSTWNEDISIGRLFGHLCSGSEFAHDDFMRQTLEQTDDDNDQCPKKRARYDADASTESSQSSDAVEEGHADMDDTRCKPHSTLNGPMEQTYDTGQYFSHVSPRSLSPPTQTATSQTKQLPDTDPERAKRDEIRRAHRYLQQYANPEILQVGPLPSSWPTDKVNASQMPSPKTPSKEPQESSFASIGDGASSLHSQTRQPSQTQDSQYTDLGLSISESDLDASPPPGMGPDRDLGHVTEERTTKDRITRRRARVAAYLAAREDSWAEVSLVSAGGNHAEEEIEL